VSRYQAALAYLGQRYEERGGFITPQDVKVAVIRYADGNEVSLEAWLISEARRSGHFPY